MEEAKEVHPHKQNKKKHKKKAKKKAKEIAQGKEETYALHRAVWRRDLNEINRLLDSGEVTDIDARDCHGNPALHLAVHFRYRDVVQLLLERGADPTYKNGGMWSAMQEACASGDPKIVGDLMLAVKNKVGDEFQKRIPHLIEALEKLPDFYLELKWEFRSWVPLVSRFCPNDLCKVWKRGACFRVDTTLKGFENMHWIRGNLSIMFVAEQKTAAVCVVDHDRKTIEYMLQSLADYSRDDVEMDVLEVMSHSLVRPMAKPEKIIFKPKYGWFGGERTEDIEGWEAKLYDIEGFEYVTRHRNSKKKKKGIPFPEEETGLTDMEHYFSTTVEDDENKHKDENFKGSGLLYPSEFTTEKVRTFSGTAWFAPDFPHKVQELVPVFEVLAPRNKHFEKLQKLVDVLPDYGFPIKIEVPVFPTVSAMASFLKYEDMEEMDEEFFALPKGYKRVRTKPKPGPHGKQQHHGHHGHGGQGDKSKAPSKKGDTAEKEREKEKDEKEKKREKEKKDNNDEKEKEK